jgi:phosphate-selective porin OprO and OprP
MRELAVTYRRFIVLLMLPLTFGWPETALGQSANIALSSTPGGPAAPPSLQELRDRIVEIERQLGALKQLVAQVDVQQEKLAATGGEAAATPSVDERLDALDQRLRVFAREDEIRREAQAEQAKTAPGIGASRDGFQLRSADGSFLLRLRGLSQTDSRFFAADSGAAATDTFLMRRVRPMVEATMFKNFVLFLMPDFGNGTTVVQDAYADLRFTTAFRIRAGKQKQPFGIERLVSASELLFGERALPTTVAGNRDVGVMAYGDLLSGRLSYYGGLFNGVADGGSADADDRDGKDVVVRIFSHPFRTSTNERLQGLGLGVAASHGSQRGTALAPGLASYRSPGQQIYFRYALDNTADGTVIADGTRRRISAQGYYYAGRLGLLAEQVFSSQAIRRGASAIDAGVSSWQIAPSWVLTGERASYRGVGAPKNNFDPANGTWGAFEIAARYNEVRIGDEVFPIFASRLASASKAQAGAAGLNWYLNRNIKIVFNYEETRFTGGLPSGDRRPEREFLSRVQFSF